MNLGRILLAGRLAKLAVIAVALLAFLAWWKLGGDHGAPVAHRDVPGVVAEVHEKAYRVRLNDGRTVVIPRTGNLAQGAPVVLSATSYANGEEHFSLDSADAR